VLEYASEGPLDAWLLRNASTVTVARRVAIALGVARGVSHLHAEHVVHGAVCARTVLLTSEIVAKVTIGERPHQPNADGNDVSVLVLNGRLRSHAVAGTRAAARANGHQAERRLCVRCDVV
jgi:tRNA A-37 threonylcarbamoyl transferase component Bud32